MKKLITSLLLGLIFASAVPVIPATGQLAYAATEEVYQCQKCGRKETPVPFLGLPQLGCGGSTNSYHCWTKLDK